MFELGGGSLTLDEQRRIKAALEAETSRIQSVAVGIRLGDDDFAGGM